MNVVVTLNDGTTINPVYAPEHISEVIGFYTKQLWQNAISGFIATLDNGQVIKLGAN